MIREVEEHSLKSMPALITTDYDGWIIREAKGHTKRANSVNFQASGSEPLLEKIKFCEKYYADINQPCIFRINPLAFPGTLDTELEARGYIKVDPTDVCIRDLKKNPASAPLIKVSLETELSGEWLEAMARLTGLSDHGQSVLTEIFSQLTLKPCFASIKVEGEIVACGLAVLSNRIAGLFEFATDPAHQRQGYAQAIVEGLLKYASEKNVEHAYLQVVQSNLQGLKFWRAMGFDTLLYRYHYRIKR